MVVGQHIGRSGDDVRRTAVIDLQRVLVRSGEVLPEIDQILGGRSRVSIDDLVVVANTEAAVGRRAQEPDQQHVGGVEVLELIHQKVPAATLRDGPCVGVT